MHSSRGGTVQVFSKFTWLQNALYGEHLLERMLCIDHILGEG